jgi:hypothetical protein
LRQLFGVGAIVLFLGAFLSTASAEVSEIGPSGRTISTDIELYSDQVSLYRWLEKIAQEAETGTWSVDLTQNQLEDVVERLNAIALASALNALTPSIGQSDAMFLADIGAVSNADKVCGDGAASVGCELEKDLLSTGWTDPNSNAGSNDFQDAPTGGGEALSNDRFILMGDRARIFALEDLQLMLDQALFSPCCSLFGEPNNLSDAGPNIRSDGSNVWSVDGSVDDVGPPSPSIEKLPGGSPVGGPHVTDPFPPSTPASIPEPSIPAMLMIGICGFTLAKRNGVFRWRFSRVV